MISILCDINDEFNLARLAFCNQLDPIKTELYNQLVLSRDIIRPGYESKLPSHRLTWLEAINANEPIWYNLNLLNGVDCRNKSKFRNLQSIVLNV